MIATSPSPLNVAQLEGKAVTLRRRLITTSAKAKIPHLGSCLSCVELLVHLYWQELHIDPANPEDPGRDRFLLSKGHGAPILFHEHPPKPGYIPGIEAATGSLGHGLPMALGMALAARIQQRPSRCYALLSDGECNEGSIWEAALLAASQKLDTLTAIIDFNKWQATGRSQEVLALDPLPAKWESFGWHAQEIDGHDFAAIKEALVAARAEAERPSVIIAHTIKGKGVSFMEDNNNWHYRTPNPEELESALAELEPI
jgi:transketolase